MLQFSDMLQISSEQWPALVKELYINVLLGMPERTIVNAKEFREFRNGFNLHLGSNVLSLINVSLVYSYNCICYQANHYFLWCNRLSENLQSNSFTLHTTGSCRVPSSFCHISVILSRAAMLHLCWLGMTCFPRLSIWWFDTCLEKAIPFQTGYTAWFARTQRMALHQMIIVIELRDLSRC